MLIGLLRPTETRTVELEGESLADVAGKAAAETPAGWELLSAPVRMRKGSTILDATATIARRDQTREIEADDMTALRAKVPDGAQLVHVRSV